MCLFVTIIRFLFAFLLCPLIQGSKLNQNSEKKIVEELVLLMLFCGTD
uniref:Uncharacterized protein n=1 Tax=Arundo donax TaxID=35708 RepID=A0A0A9C5A5_ARUDO